MIRNIAVILFALTMLPSFSTGETRTRHRPRTAENIDIERYMGTWIEIARIPTKHQKSCTCCATATYSRRDDGLIIIVNDCVEADGTVKSAKAEARVSKGSNARWRATFFKVLGLGVGKGDYWILGVGEDYEWAVVGDPKRKYGWILARNPELTAAEAGTIDALLVDRGYDPADFVPTPGRKDTP